MADQEPYRPLLKIIQDYAIEKSQGERHVEDLKRRHSEIAQELAAATTLLETTKSRRKLAEQDLKGLEVELASVEATIQVQQDLQIRIYSQQEEIAKASSELEGLEASVIFEFLYASFSASSIPLRMCLCEGWFWNFPINEEAISREDFINTLLEINRKIRNIQECHKEARMQSLLKEKYDELSYLEGLQGTCQPKEEEVTDHKNVKDLSLKVNACGERVDLITHKISEKTEENEELQRIHKEITQEHTDLHKKLALMEAVLQESKELQVLSKQTTELEQVCTSFSDQLQKSYFCPKCGVDNV